MTDMTLRKIAAMSVVEEHYKNKLSMTCQGLEMEDLSLVKIESRLKMTTCKTYRPVIWPRGKRDPADSADQSARGMHLNFETLAHHCLESQIIFLLSSFCCDM